MFFSESSKGTSLPTGFLAFCYGVALIGICAQINRLYVDANPMPAITVADDILQWMVGSAMVAGALAAWQVRAETLPGPGKIITSILILSIGIISGLLSAPLLLRFWVRTVEGDIDAGRFYLVFHFLPSSESVFAAMAYVGVSYLLVLALPLLSSYRQLLKTLVPVMLLGGISIMGIEVVGSYSAKQDMPVAGAIRTEVRAQTEEERHKWLEADCDAGNGKACSDLVSAERRHSGEEGERRIYTKVCQRNISMEFPPCEQLVEILSHSVSREEAIDQVCALSVEGCTSVAHTFEGQYTMIYAQHAHRVVCGTQPENDSCRRMQELALLVEPELVAPPQPTGGGPFCDDDPTSCLDLAGGLVKEGRYEHAAWLYYTWCKSHKSPLEDCGTWLQLARWRTYFSEAVKHLLETKALKASVDNPRTIRPLIEATCAKGDGMSCFFLAVLTEIAQPKDVEATRKVYKRACDLGYVRGCTNALSISSRHPGEGMPLPSDAEQRYSVLCFERNEAESCGQLAILSVQQFEWKGAHRQEVDRAGMRTLLEQTCQREVAARLGDKDACRQFNRLKRGSSLTG